MRTPRLLLHDAYALELCLDEQAIYVGGAALYRIEKGSGAVRKLLPSVDDVKGIGVDATHVYWAEIRGAVRRVPKMGGAAELVLEGAPNPWALAVDEEAVFWSANGVHQWGKADRVTTTVLDWFQVFDLGVDKGDLFVVDLNERGVWKVPKRGGEPTKLSDARYATSLAVSGDSVYWYDRGDPFDQGDGAVYTVPKLGGGRRLLAGALPDVGKLAADETHLYFGTASGLHRVAKGGGSVEKLVSPPASSIVVDETDVYFTTGQGDVFTIAK